MGRKAVQCNKTFTPYGIFIFTPSLEGWSTKAKEAPPLDIKLTPTGHQPNISISQGFAGLSFGFCKAESCHRENFLNDHSMTLYQIGKYYYHPILLSLLLKWIIESLLIFFKVLKTYSCVNQLLAISHEILSSFDDSCKVRGVFLDIVAQWN